jgi:hypothetical protein
LIMAGYQVEQITERADYFSLLVRRPVTAWWKENLSLLLDSYWVQC